MRYRLELYWQITLIGIVGVTSPAAAVDYVNPTTRTYDSHPVAAVAADGSSWVAWHGYDRGEDAVYARRMSPAPPQPVERLSSGGPVNGPPTLCVADEAIWVFWTSRVDNRWVIQGRRYLDNQWQEIEVLSAPAEDSFEPAATHLPGKGLLLAWTSRGEDQFEIRARQFDGRRWLGEHIVSISDQDAFRARAATTADGRVRLAWDAYDGRQFAVYSRVFDTNWSEPEQVSPENEHCLSATLLETASGSYAAWLRKQDVVGGPGVISQLHTLQAARRDPSGWTVVEDESGNRTAAELTQGLMAKIAPQIVPTGGYLGRRTAPLLAEIGQQVWLIWERKSDHRGATWNVRGDLIARPIEGDEWGSARTIHSGLIDYRLIAGSLVSEDELALMAATLPRESTRRFQQFTCRLSEAKPFVQEPWPGWHPIQLPVASELPPRQTIEVGGKQLQLYWADLHCHSGLTADAEGEPDELMFYARDRARLDVVVFTNNDFLYDVPLTGYEYALSNFLAAAHSNEDFLALPGYEWTSRVPGISTASVADAGNWTPPYRNRSYPNHRSVIYPRSGGPLVHFSEVENNIAELHTAVAAAGGVTLTQHDAFAISGHPAEVGLELTSGWRRYIARVPELFHGALNSGMPLGFVACGDSHRRAPGLSGALTGIFAAELTDAAILDALRRRRCFATSGSRIFLDARANGRLMGEVVSAEEGRVVFTLNAIGTRPLLSATLVNASGEVARFDGEGARRLQLRHVEEGLPPGRHWYYWRVEQLPPTPDLPGNLNPAFGHLAWSSPHYVATE